MQKSFFRAHRAIAFRNTIEIGGDAEPHPAAAHDVSVPLDGLQPFLGRSFDGILGYGFLSRFVVELDSTAVEQDFALRNILQAHDQPDNQHGLY